MPKVPVVTQQSVLPSAAARGTLDVSVSPEQFGAGVGRGLGNVAQNLVKMQGEADATAATDAFNQASRVRGDYLNKGDEAIYNQQGKNAVGSYDTSRTFFNDTFTKFSSVLENENQRKAFKSLWDRSSNVSLDNVARFEAKHTKVYHDDTQKANLKMNINNASNNFNKPDEIELSLQNADTIIRANAAGHSEAVVLQKQTEARSEIHKSVIDRMMTDDPDGAREYYNLNKKQVDGQHHKQIESALKGNKQKRQAQDAGDKILASNKSDPEMRLAAKKQTDSDVRQLTVAQVDKGIRDRKTDRIETDRQMIDAFWKSGFLENPRVEDIPENLPHAAKVVALEYAKNPNVKTVFSEWSKLDTMFTEDFDAFRKEDLNSYIHTVSTTDLKTFKNKQSLDEVKARRVQSTNARAKQTFEKSTNKKIDTTSGALFMRKYQENIDRKIDANKRDVTPAEEIEILDRMLIEKDVPGFFSFIHIDDQKRVFELTIDDVPDKDKDEIIKEYELKGIAPTENQILELYKLGVK